MDYQGCWSELPDLILTELYKYLNHNERLTVSTTCKNWRYALYQSCFWDTLHFEATARNSSKNAFINLNTAQLYKTVQVNFEPRNRISILQTISLLDRLSNSTCIQSLILQPQCGELNIPIDKDKDSKSNVHDYVTEFFLTPILNLLRNVSIRVLDFGGFERLCLSGNEILATFARPQEVTTLGFASIKEDPGGYELADFYSPTVFARFTSLQIISLDYDILDETLLTEFRNLKRLIIHVHGLEHGHEGLPDECWEHFRIHNPEAKVRMTLINALEAVEVLPNKILRPSIPLTHFRVLFCFMLNLEAIEFISRNYKDTIESVAWVDEIYSHGELIPMDTTNEEQDPFVMMAWRCKQLTEIIIHGYSMDADSLVAIARLRGPGLCRLELRDVGIRGIEDEDDFCKDFLEEMGSQLGQPWHPVENTVHHPYLNGDILEHDKKIYRDEYVYNNYLKSDLILSNDMW